jgi:uncharacterized membrane protein YidH (DUF202 family)
MPKSVIPPVWLEEPILTNGNQSDHESVIINEVQLLLAEKRTSLAAVRTGIAVLALPLSVMGILVATSKYYDVVHVLPLFIPLALLCFALSVLGLYLIIRSIIRLRHHDHHIMELKRKHGEVAEFID